MLKSLHRLFQCGLDHLLGSRKLAGFNSVSNRLAQHADRTEFQRKHAASAVFAQEGPGRVSTTDHDGSSPSRIGTAALRSAPSAISEEGG
jgi:hypothetical protein